MVSCSSAGPTASKATNPKQKLSEGNFYRDSVISSKLLFCVIEVFGPSVCSAAVKTDHKSGDLFQVLKLRRDGAGTLQQLVGAGLTVLPSTRCGGLRLFTTCRGDLSSLWCLQDSSHQFQADQQNSDQNQTSTLCSGCLSSLELRRPHSPQTWSFSELIERGRR